MNHSLKRLRRLPVHDSVRSREDCPGRQLKPLQQGGKRRAKGGHEQIRMDEWAPLGIISAMKLQNRRGECFRDGAGVRIFIAIGLCKIFMLG